VILLPLLYFNASCNFFIFSINCSCVNLSPLSGCSSVDKGKKSVMLLRPFVSVFVQYITYAINLALCHSANCFASYALRYNKKSRHRIDQNCSIVRPDSMARIITSSQVLSRWFNFFFLPPVCFYQQVHPAPLPS
jgi:hypothetical protein